MGIADIDARIAARIRAARAAKGLSLDGLAAASGVSRAMLSRIERAESSPTARLLVRLCAGLGTTLADLLTEADSGAGGFARRVDQPVWRDPETGYRRRAVSPQRTPMRASLVEVEFPARARVRLDNRGLAGAGQFVWLLAGALDVTAGGIKRALAAGDCLYVPFGGPVEFRNPGRVRARYAVIAEFGGA